MIGLFLQWIKPLSTFVKKFKIALVRLFKAMRFLLFLSDHMIPLIIFYIIGFGALMKVNVFTAFLKGAMSGFRVVLDIGPTLIALMMAVGILRVSGGLDMIGNLLAPVTERLHFPEQLVPLALTKMVSSSAATSLLLDIFKEYGTDSTIGRVASIMMSCTETIFYTMSVYFTAASVQKSRYTLAGALCATLVGIGVSVVLGNL